MCSSDLIQQFSGAHTESTIFRYWSGQFFGTRTDSTFSRYLPGFNNFLVVTLILPFFVLVRTVFRHSHEFHFLPIVAQIEQFFGTHTDSTIFPYWSGQFFGTRTDSTFSRYSPGSLIFRYSHCFYHFSVLVRTVLRYSHGFHLFLVLARIQQFSGAHTDSTIFSYWSGQFFGTRTDSTFSRYSPGLNNFLVLTLILPILRTGPESFSVLARIPPFPGTCPDSTIFWCSH